jgi:hypothetical protein
MSKSAAKTTLLFSQMNFVCVAGSVAFADPPGRVGWRLGGRQGVAERWGHGRVVLDRRLALRSAAARLAGVSARSRCHPAEAAALGRRAHGPAQPTPPRTLVAAGQGQAPHPLQVAGQKTI